MVMLDLPLHPVVVHFPIALAFLLPIVSLLTLVAIVSKRLPFKAWLGPVFIALLFFVTAVIAAQLGEADEEIVEVVVGESVLHEHEEAGERVQWAALAVLLTYFIPFLFKKYPKTLVIPLLASIIGTVPVILAGHTGGLLVYKHGAAGAYSADKTNNKPSDNEDSSGDD